MLSRVSKGIRLRGFDKKHAILIYEGKILDGRHRYLAAVKAGVDPIFTEFQGTRKEAVKEVTKEQVDRGHWSDEAKNSSTFKVLMLWAFSLVAANVATNTKVEMQ